MSVSKLTFTTISGETSYSNFFYLTLKQILCFGVKKSNFWSLKWMFRGKWCSTELFLINFRAEVTSRWCFLTAKKKIYGRESINLHIWPWKNRNVSVRPNSSCIERSVWGKFKKNFVWKLDKMNKLCPFD